MKQNVYEFLEKFNVMTVGTGALHSIIRKTCCLGSKLFFRAYEQLKLNPKKFLLLKQEVKYLC